MARAWHSCHRAWCLLKKNPIVFTNTCHLTHLFVENCRFYTVYTFILPQTSEKLQSWCKHRVNKSALFVRSVNLLSCSFHFDVAIAFHSQCFEIRAKLKWISSSSSSWNSVGKPISQPVLSMRNKTFISIWLGTHCVSVCDYTRIFRKWWINKFLPCVQKII